MMTTSLALTLWLSGGAASLPADAAENRRTAPATGVVVAPGPDGSVSVEALLAALKADASQRGGSARTMKIGLAEEVTWSDGALGCPQPGLTYTQALVPGWRVRIEVDGRTWTYHASRRGQWLWCPAGGAVAPGTGPAAR